MTALAAVPASATTINLSGAGAAVTNVQEADVDQVAAAVNVNIGSQVDSLVDQSATAANNVASVDINVDQSSLGLNGALTGVEQVNLSLAAVDQNVYAINGAGALLNSDVMQAATAANNVGSVDVVVTQD